MARKGILITTPNRWHPLESHTGLPLLHYLPPRIWRPVYQALGKSMYADEESLHLLSAAELLDLVRRQGIFRTAGWNCTQDPLVGGGV